jgi:uncharacterized protein YcbK (DUF882 family)
LFLAAGIGGPGAGAGAAEERSLSFYNIHTKESLSIVYKRDGKFVPEALDKLNHFMRDWRRNVTVKMDPALYDLIWDMYRELGSKKPIHVICGHRSPATNAVLRKTRGGQARESRHITGQAIDLHFPDVSVKQLRNSALIRERGGVGYYPTSAIPFIHVDTGNVRHWPRLPRQELAILFPNGQSKHVPSDGKPITKADFRMALASLQEKGGELPIALRGRYKLDTAPGPMLASLTSTPAPAPVPTLAPAVMPPAPEAKKPAMVLASLSPFPKFGETAPTAAPAAPLATPASLTKPLVQARGEPTSAKADLETFTNGILNRNSGPSLVNEAVAAAEYDDDHPDETAYQPFPVLPFMADTPVASMDLSGDMDAFDLSKVHLHFAEAREMLDTQFQPGLQYAQMFWAQRFRGTAVNTALKRLVRQAPGDEPVRTAQQSAR